MAVLSAKLVLLLSIICCSFYYCSAISYPRQHSLSLPLLARSSSSKIGAKSSDEKVALVGAKNAYANILGQKSNFIEQLNDGWKRNVDILSRGIKGMFSNFSKNRRLRKIVKQNGKASISFTDFQSLETAKEDFSKCLRLLFTSTFGPEFFFYSYVVFPMMQSSNPFSWRSLPSSFDIPEFKLLRRKIMKKRRIQTLMSAVQAINNEAIEDVPEKKRFMREEFLDVLEAALSESSLEKSMALLSPYYTVNVDSKPSRSVNNIIKKATNLNYEHIPSSVVKDCVRSFGFDGVPSIPLIGRLNRGDLNRYLEKIRDSDSYLMKKGTNNLNAREIRLACFERCINDRRPTKDLHRDLNQWLSIMSISGENDLNAKKKKIIPTSGVVEKYQEKRLALMSLFVVKDLRQSEFASPYKALLK